MIAEKHDPSMKLQTTQENLIAALKTIRKEDQTDWVNELGSRGQQYVYNLY